MAAKITNISRIMLILALSVWVIAGCSEDEADNEPDIDTVASCEGCHTNYAHLQEVYTPDTVAPPGGCGGEAPHYEPYDRVYMDGDGYESYKQSGHYNIGCVGCHNGIDNTSEKEKARIQFANEHTWENNVKEIYKRIFEYEQSLVYKKKT
jgi:hypothetical protein